jgi:signal transduction histidine kinase
VVRRFLNRSSISNRLVGLLLVSVVVPGLVLAWYGVQAVLQEDELYEATLRERAKEMASFLHRDLADRMDSMLGDLDGAVAEAGGDWVSDPGSAAEAVAHVEPLVSSVLVLDTEGTLRHPRRAATGLLDRHLGRSADRTWLGPLLAEGEELELKRGDPDAAVAAYDAARRSIPGQRGRAIASLALARSLLAAERYAEALAAFDRLALESADELDLNDFPVGLLARHQAALALVALGRNDEAARRLLELTEALRSEPWTFGGYGETALARRTLDRLAEPALLEALPAADRPNIERLRRRFDEAAARQADEATVLRFLPVLTADPGQRSQGGAAFELASVRLSDRTLSLAHRRWTHRGDRRLLVVVLDDRAVRAEVEASLTTAARANPEFRSELRPSGDAASTAPGFRVVQSLEPWLPGLALHVTRGEEVLGSARRQQRWVRLGMIAALLVIILVGLLVITRAVSREVEIARLKSDFVSSVSHELRTPLTTIRIMAEMLALGAVPSGEKQAEYYRNIVSEAERLTRLINNVLDFARIEEGRKKFQYGMGDIGDAVYEVERITGDYARKEGFELKTTVDEGLPATAFDRDAIIQALINLMSNAVKYSREDKRIEMGARCERDSIVLWVQDHGPGIDSKEVPHLFEKFYRGGDHMTREAGGTGLGLSIVQHIVAAHRGRVGVKTKPGEGSRFEIVLPVSQVQDLAGAEKRR